MVKYVLFNRVCSFFDHEHESGMRRMQRPFLSLNLLIMALWQM